MRRLMVGVAAVVLALGMSGLAQAALSFETGVDTMSYNITTWSIRTDWTGTWSGKTPTYFMFNAPGWATRYTSTSGVAYTQTMTGTAVGTDVFSQADLQAVATGGNGWATMGGGSSPISIWEYGGQFLKQSGGNNASWADDVYWASNEYGSTGSAASTVVTEFTGTFVWDGKGNHVEGKILADDWAKIYLNDTLIYTTDTCAYDAVEVFSSDGLLLSGSNTLKVIVYNTGQGSATAGPMALQLDITPEPATMALLALGGVGMLARRRRGK